jgi:hypothetical protein
VLFVIDYAMLGAWFEIASGHDGRSIIVTAVSALVLAIVITGIIAVVRRRDQAIAGTRQRDDWVMIVRALHTGDAPSNASFDQGLRTLAAKRRVDLRRLPWLFSSMTLLCLVVTVMLPDARSIVLTCLLGLASLGTWRDRVRGSARLTRLAETLQSRSSSTPFTPTRSPRTQ